MKLLPSSGSRKTVLQFQYLTYGDSGFLMVTVYVVRSTSPVSKHILIRNPIHTVLCTSSGTLSRPTDVVRSTDRTILIRISASVSIHRS